MKRTMLAAAMVLGFTGSALAQTEENVRQEPDKVIYRTHDSIMFDEVAVGGVRTQSGIENVIGRKPAKFDNLIKVRMNFIPELQGSVDNL